MTKDNEPLNKEDVTKIKNFFASINLNKRFPDYINKNVFRFFFLLIFLVVVANFFLDGGSLNSYNAECDLDFCENPFYQDPMAYSNGLNDRQCEYLHCDREYIYKGEVFKRDDIFINRGKFMMLFFFFFSFVANHIVWMVKKNVYRN